MGPWSAPSSPQVSLYDVRAPDHYIESATVSGCANIRCLLKQGTPTIEVYIASWYLCVGVGVGVSVGEGVGS